MKVKLQARQMWDAVEYGGVDDHEDLRALEALLAAVPPEMVSVLAKKPTAKLAWEAIAQMRVGSDRARWSTLQKLRQEWDCLAFRPARGHRRLLPPHRQLDAEAGDVRRRRHQRGAGGREASPHRPRQVHSGCSGGGDDARPLRAHGRGGDGPSQGRRRPQAVSRRADHRGWQASSH